MDRTNSLQGTFFQKALLTQLLLSQGSRPYSRLV